MRAASTDRRVMLPPLSAWALGSDATWDPVDGITGLTDSTCQSPWIPVPAWATEVTWGYGPTPPEAPILRNFRFVTERGGSILWSTTSTRLSAHTVPVERDGQRGRWLYMWARSLSGAGHLPHGGTLTFT